MQSIAQCRKDEQTEIAKIRSRAALSQWRSGERPSTDGIASAGHLADRLEAGLLFLPGVPALDCANFKSRACKPVAQAILATTVMWRGNDGGEAMPATYVELARLARVSKRTAQNAVSELEASGWLERYAAFRPGGVGRDGKHHKVFQTANRYVAGPTLRLAWNTRKHSTSIRVATLATPPKDQRKKQEGQELRCRPRADRNTEKSKSAMKGARIVASCHNSDTAPRAQGSFWKAYEDAMRLVEAQKALQDAPEREAVAS